MPIKTIDSEDVGGVKVEKIKGRGNPIKAKQTR